MSYLNGDKSSRIPLSKDKRYSIIAKANFKCEACGAKWPHIIGSSPILQVHHINPVRLGGANSIENLIVLCPNDHALAHAIQRCRKSSTQLDRRYYCESEFYASYSRKDLIDDLRRTSLAKTG